MPKVLKDVTLLGVDCINIRNLIDVAQVCQKQMKFGAVKLLTSIKYSHPNVVQIEHIGTIEKYSEFIIKELFRYVDTEFVLIIQYDGFILNPNSWEDDFLNYDYIGAPWWYSNGMNVGNGGFSLRSKKLMQILAEDDKIRIFHPEDHHICITYRVYLESLGIKFASESLSRKFSIEANYKEGFTWNGQFGFHSYATDLSRWRMYSYVNIFSDFNFIKWFRKSRRMRLLIGFPSEILDQYTGNYAPILPNDSLTVIRVGHTLLVRFGQKKAIFYPYNSKVFFSDSANEIIKFLYSKSLKSTVMVRRHSGKNSIYRKENLLN